MQVLLYQQKIEDTKHKITFNKDKISYRFKTFDAVIDKKTRPLIESAIASGLHYPLALELDDSDYFTKMVSYTRADGTKGMKTRVVIMGVREISQGEFESRSLDDVVDDIEAEYGVVREEGN